MSDEETWRDKALCKQKKVTSLFYRDDAVGIVVAKTYCKRCPVEGACLIDALSRNEEFGIWGGKTAAERRKLSVYFKAAVSSGISSLH